MGKILGIITGAILIGVAFATGGGSLGFLGLTVSKGTLIAMGATLALSNVSMLMMGPKIPKSQLERLNVSLDPTTPRKAVLGTTALNLDLRYHEASGTNQEYIDYIIAVAAHRIKSIDEIWFEEKLAWSATGGVTPTYNGYLTIVFTILEGGPSNYFTVNSGSKWGPAQRLSGCAQVQLRIKRSGYNEETQSPLASGLPNRITIIGNGAVLYDPRRDSTVPGGSGTHRVNDQSTWGYYADPDDTDNPALQLLWYLLGWRINGQISVGCGVPPARIDLPSFITAANICDENVILATGGTQKRYRTSGTISDSDDRMEIINTFLSCMNASLRDSNGKLSLTIIKNDLADYVLTFDDSDILGEFEWNQTRGLSESYNKVRGRYVDPSYNSLYQLVDYPEVGFPSPDGIDRVMTLDLPYVEDGRRAQRIAKQVLQRNQYKGMFSATFTAKAQGCNVGDVVRLTFAPLGWTNKLFRVVSQEIGFDGQVPMALIEENAAIYAWDAEDTAPVTPNAPVIYDPLNNPLFIAVDGKISSYASSTAPTATAIGDIWIDTDDNNKMYRWDGTSWVSVRDDGKVTTFYSTSTPIAQAIGDLWYNSSTLILKRWNGSLWQDTATYGATPAQVSAIAAAQADADAAYALADGKIETFYQTTMPTTASLGDLWFDTDDQNKLYRWNSSAWVLVQDGAIGDAITAAAGAQATADSKIVTFFATATPTAEAIGDLWYNSSTLLLKRWNGSAWVDTATNGAPSGTTVGGRDADTISSTIKTDGVINTDKVNTPSIQANSVNAIATAYSTGSVSTTTAGATLAIQTVSITSTGNTILVNSSSIVRVQVSSGSLPTAVKIVIWVSWTDNVGNSGTLVNNVQPTFVHTSNVQTDMLISVPAVHSSTVSGRTYTYTLNAQYSSASIVGISGLDNRIMTAQEVKR